MKRKEDKISWKLSPDGDELIIHVKVASLVRLVLDETGDDYEGRVRSFAKRVLTEQEMAVLPHLLRGRRRKEIGSLLNIAERTVAFHSANIYQKLGVHNRGELMMLNFREGKKGEANETKVNGGLGHGHVVGAVRMSAG